MNIIQVSENLMTPSKKPVRQELGDINELADSINRHGLLNPLTVRPLEEGYEIIAGHRRFEALKKLGWREIPCRVLEASDKDAYETSLVENIQRKTLDPIEEAEVYEKYLVTHRFGTQRQLANAVGKDERYISHVLMRLEIPEETRRRLGPARVPASTIDTVDSLKPEERAEVLEKTIDEGLTRREVRDVKKRVKAGESVEQAVEKVKKEREKKHSGLSPRVTTRRLKPTLEQVSKKINDLERSESFLIRKSISFIEIILKTLEDKSLYCPEHHNSTLNWSCCGKTVQDTKTFLEELLKGESKREKKK